MAVRPRSTCCYVLATLAVLPIAACRVSKNKSGDGKRVEVRTPLGGVSVNTDQSTIAGKVGLAIYPGAVPEQKHGDDNSSADVDFGFGSFRLRVVAAGFETSASPAEVEAFYRKQLQQYSDVIECSHGVPVGSPSKTGLGLTCDHSNSKKVRIGEIDKDDDTELKAGSPSRQHIVGFQSKASGTHFALVSLELPRDSDKGQDGN